MAVLKSAEPSANRPTVGSRAASGLWLAGLGLFWLIMFIPLGILSLIALAVGRLRRGD